MVPTLTRLGRFSECTRWVIAVPEVPTALVTLASMTRRSKSWAIGAEFGASAQVIAWSRRCGDRDVPPATDRAIVVCMSGVTGIWERLRRALTGGRRPPLDPGRTDLVVVVSSFEDAESCSGALERGAAAAPRWVDTDEAVLRHHLELPAEAVDRAVELAGQDGYTPAAPVHTPAEGYTGLVLQRVQILDAMHCAQEKSRMAGLAQRLGGTATGWDALQPDSAAD